jgi:hypothetical protein
MAHPLMAQQEASVTRLSEPVQVTDTHEVFGAPLGEMGQPLQLAEVIQNESDYLGKQVYVSARVTKVCQKKGCFFLAQDGAAMARVTFIDYSFFVPTDSGEKVVDIVGTLDKKTLDEDQARHYAQDAGTGAQSISGPRQEYSIVASSVVIPRS